jgi:two-component system, NtrC family, sensor histidine kinase HydH
MAKLQPSTVSDSPLGPHSEPGAIGEAPTVSSSARAAASAIAGELAPVLPSSEEEPDITRRLRAQYTEISQLAGGLAHEIRNPLSTVSLNLDLLAEDFQKPETPRDRRVLQRVERLQHEVYRLRDILENFLRFARVQELGLVSTDLNKIVEELCDFYEPTASSKGILIRTFLAHDLPLTRIDADLLKQALLNLILNAEHAMPSGGELMLTTRRENGWVVLHVIDTGVGMTEEVRARIFDAFFSTRPAGSGLGLPTARKIIEAHGGTIQVQSEPGKGSQFTVRLPVSEPRPPGQRAPSAEERAQPPPQNQS